MAPEDSSVAVRSYRPEHVGVAEELMKDGRFHQYMAWLHMHLVVLYTRDMRIPYAGDLLSDCELVHRWRDGDIADVPSGDFDRLLDIGVRIAAFEWTVDFRRNFLVTDKTPDEFDRSERIDAALSQGKLFRAPRLEMPGPNLRISDRLLQTGGEDARRKIIELFERSHEF